MIERIIETGSKLVLPKYKQVTAIADVSPKLLVIWSSELAAGRDAHVEINGHMCVIERVDPRPDGMYSIVARDCGVIQ